MLGDVSMYDTLTDNIVQHRALGKSLWNPYLCIKWHFKKDALFDVLLIW